MSGSNCDFLWLVDGSGAIYTRQPGWEAFSGQVWPQYQGHGWLDFFPSASAAEIRRQFAEHEGGAAGWQLQVDPPAGRLEVMPAELANANSPRVVLLRTAHLPAGDAALRDAKIAAIRQLSQKLAHDLRNPLGVIRLSASLMKRHVEDRPVAMECLAEIDANVQAADAVLGDVLEATNHSGLNYGQVRFREVFDEVTARIDSSGRVEWVLSSDAAALLTCDRHALRRMLYDLMKNAFEAMRGQGVVTVVVRPDGEHWVIDVSDFGPGVAPEMRDRLFEPLATTKRAGGGLGLFRSRHIAERLGGTVAWVGGETGATFRIKLPRTPPTP